MNHSKFIFLIYWLIEIFLDSWRKVFISDVKLFLISAPKQQNLGAKKFDRPPRFTGNSAALPARPDTYGSEDVRVSDGTSFETGATTKLAIETCYFRLFLLKIAY